jgi:hypothetical protein
MREGDTSRVMAADKPYGEFYHFYSQSGIFWIHPRKIYWPAKHDDVKMESQLLGFAEVTENLLSPNYLQYQN